MSDPARILIIKPSALGDVVHTLPVLRLLRKRFPSATIDWVISAPLAPLLEGHPDLQDPIPLHRSPAGFVSVAREIRRRGYDLVLDLQGLLRSGVLARATGSATRVGFAAAREFASLAYTHKVPPQLHPRHAVERYLDMAEFIGCGRGPVEFVFASTAADHEWAKTQTHSLGKFAVLAPGTNWPSKRWPIEHFAQLAQILRERGMSVVVVGSSDAVELAPQIKPDLNLAARTSLKQLVEIIGLAEVVVANDSGPMHIAAALGTPLVVPFGPTNPTLTGPYLRPESVLQFPLPCSGCLSRKCSHLTCLRRIAPQIVADSAARQLLQIASIHATEPTV